MCVRIQPSLHQKLRNQYKKRIIKKRETMGIVSKPWELGEIKESNNFSPFSIPDVCKGKHLLVRLAPPKGKGVRDGLVATFLMTSFFDESDNPIELVDVKENAGGYKISFPLGKRGLIATKYRGPSSYYRYLDTVKNQFYQIPQERFTPEGALAYCEENPKNIPELEGFKDKADIERDEILDQYFQDLYLFGISQDLVLPIEDDKYKEPFVGIQSELYRVYTAPKEGERYGNIIITKWRRGKPSLSGDFTEVVPALAEAIHLEYQARDNDDNVKFDPTSFVEDKEDDEII